MLFIDKHELPYHDNVAGNRIARSRILEEIQYTGLGKKERKLWDLRHKYQGINLKSR